MNRIIFLLVFIHTASGFFWYWPAPPPTYTTKSPVQIYPEFPSPKSCPENFFALNEKFCYFISEDKKNFYKAFDSCRVLKSSMIYLYVTAVGTTNFNSLAMLGGYKPENYWVGGNYLEKSKIMCEDETNQEGCLSLSIKNGYITCLDRVNCTEEHKYICEYALYK